MSKLPKRMRLDFVRLFLHLKYGSPIDEAPRLRLLTFISENMPEPKETSSNSDKMYHYDLVAEAIKQGYKTGGNSQSDSAFYVAANNSRISVGEATVKKHYYEMKKYIELISAWIQESEHPMPCPPDDYEGPVIYVDGCAYGEDKVKKEGKIITYAGVFIYNQDTQLSEKIRDANERDLSLLSDVNSHMDLDGDDIIK